MDEEQNHKLEFIFLTPLLLSNVKGFFAYDGPVYINLFSSSSAFKCNCYHENWVVIPLSSLLHGVISVSVDTCNLGRPVKWSLSLLSCLLSNEFQLSHLTGIVAEVDRILMGFSFPFSKVSKDSLKAASCMDIPVRLGGLLGFLGCFC